MTSKIIEEIERLKEEKDAVILAHYYVTDWVQEIADYVGDSYYLAKVAAGLDKKTIVFAGVSFMGESAKILNPDKTVLMPDKKYDDVAVVCYINSVAELKVHSDVCVTSSNAMKIVKSLPNKNIFFIPDENLGRYIASKLPEKNFIFNDGFCHVHKGITAENLKAAKEEHPGAEVLAHPECTSAALEYADYIGSTAGIIDYATKSDSKEFIVATELGVLYELELNNPGKKFYSAGSTQTCPNMKKVTLEKVRDCLRDNTGVVEVSDDTRAAALKPLSRMSSPPLF